MKRQLPVPTPAALWKGFDPNQGDFKEEIVKQETRNGILNAVFTNPCAAHSYRPLKGGV